MAEQMDVVFGVQIETSSLERFVATAKSALSELNSLAAAGASRTSVQSQLRTGANQLANLAGQTADPAAAVAELQKLITDITATLTESVRALQAGARPINAPEARKLYALAGASMEDPLAPTQAMAPEAAAAVAAAAAPQAEAAAAAEAAAVAETTVARERIRVSENAAEQLRRQVADDKAQTAKYSALRNPVFPEDFAAQAQHDEMIRERELSRQRDLETARALRAEEDGGGAGGGGGGGGGFFGRVFGNQFASFGRAALGGTAAFAVFGGVREAVDYTLRLQEALAQVKARMDQVGQGDQFGTLKTNILEIARDTGIAADQIAQMASRYTAVFGGAQQGSAASTATAQFSVVGGLDPNSAQDSLTAIAKAYDLNGNQVVNITDAITAASARYGQKIDEITRGTAVLAQSGDFAGISMTKLVNIIGEASQTAGTNATTIAERLTRIIPLIDAHASTLLTLARTNKDLGAVLNPSTFAQGPGAVFDVLASNFNSFNPGTQATILQDLGSGRGAQSLLPIFQNYANIQKNVADASKDAGATQRAFNEQMKTAAETLKRLREEFNQVIASLANSGILHGFSDVLTVVENLLKAFGTINDLLAGWPAKLVAAYAVWQLIEALVRRLGPEEAAAQAEGATGGGIAGFLKGLFSGGIGGIGGTLAKGGAGLLGGVLDFGGAAIVGSGIYSLYEAARGGNSKPENLQNDSLQRQQQALESQINSLRQQLQSQDFGSGAGTLSSAGNLNTSDAIQKQIADKQKQLDDVKKQIADQNKATNDTVQNAADAQGVAAQTLDDIKSDYELGNATLQQYVDALKADAQSNREQAAVLAGQQKVTLLKQAAKEESDAAKLISDSLLKGVELQNTVSTVNGDPASAQAEITRDTQLLQDTRFTDPNDRLQLAQKIVAAEKQQLSDMAARATSAAEAAKILRDGVQVPPEVRSTIYLEEIKSSAPEFVKAIQDAAQGDIDLTNKALQFFADAMAQGKAYIDAIAGVRDLLQQQYQLALDTYNQELAAADSIGTGALPDAAPTVPNAPPPLSPNLPQPKVVVPPTTINNTAEAAKKQQQANNDQVANERAMRNARRALQEALAGNDPIALAQAAQQAAIDAEHDAKQDQQLARQAGDANALAKAQAAEIEAQAQKIKADNQLQEAMMNLADARHQLVEAQLDAAGNTVGADQERVKADTEKLNTLAAQIRARGQDPNQNVNYIDLQRQLVQDQAKAVTDQISTTEQQIQTDLDLKRISVAQAINRLKALESVATNQQERDQIELKIKQLVDQAQKDMAWNLPSDIKLPTLYEVRRANELGGPSHYQDNRQINNNITIGQNMSRDQIVGIMADALAAGGVVYGSSPRRY